MTGQALLPLQLPTLPGDTKRWGQLRGCSLSLSIIEAAKKHTGFVLVLTPDTNYADQLEQELQFFKPPELPLLHFPDWETLPYDQFSPHQDIISARISTLYQLPTLTRGILIVPVTTLLNKIAPKEYILGNSLILDVNQRFVIKEMRTRLETAGYRNVETVYEHGEYAVRGAIMDIFPMGSTLPYRIDLFDDEIDTLRTFNPETQLSIEHVKHVRLLPAKEFPLHENAIQQFKQHWRQHFDVDFRRCSVYQDINSGIAPPGIEYFIPLFFDTCATLFDYLPANTLAMSTGDIEAAITHFRAEIENRYEDRRYDIENPILAPNDLFIAVNDVFGALKKFPHVQLSSDTVTDKAGYSNVNSLTMPEVAINAKADNPLHDLQQFMLECNARVLFCAESAGRREALLELLNRIHVKPTVVESWNEFLETTADIAITIAPLAHGLWLPDVPVAVIAEPQLFGQRVMQNRRRAKASDTSEFVIKNLTELHISSPVVHLEHGVGRYLGLETLEIDKQTTEFLTLEYAEGAKLYVPVSSLHLISRYSGLDADSAPLHRLGSDHWAKAKRKAAEQIRDTAAELLDVYARRAAKPGYSFTNPIDAYEKFASDFPFEETPDQTAAIAAVIKDMTAPTAMDRLICGDVGFGKTEVAMRATFIAVQNSKQVAILVPTTLLAQQHFESFNDRFADWPVSIEVLSRFKSSKEQQAIQTKIKEGAIDIVIGTHKLIQEGMEFKNLGLLVIDEEHRFGVHQKEKLKSFRTEVDILTLTATPIPRTLNMAMSGVRDLSIIATPPAKRLSIKTFVQVENKNVKKEAILREILRGGQVYYLHNEVKTIDTVAKVLAELVPEARVGVGHGQLRERDLERVMSDFYHKRFNVLVCTTIIETGIDVPSANTIIIDRADNFGLAQLHQLRGRVGRSHHQAYAYLLTPPPKAMSNDAIKRLEAIELADELGAGFTLATHDLEIRGAGELLGDNQSGHIHSIGFSLYMEMLEQAVESIKKGKTPNFDKPLRSNSEINFHMPAFIPDIYLSDVHTRLIMYKRISSAKTQDELKELQVEMIDRFGLLPPTTLLLFRITELKLTAQKVGIIKIDAANQSGRLEFSDDTPVDPLTLIRLIQANPSVYKFEGVARFKFMADMNTFDKRFGFVDRLLNQLLNSI